MDMSHTNIVKLNVLTVLIIKQRSASRILESSHTFLLSFSPSGAKQNPLIPLPLLLPEVQASDESPCSTTGLLSFLT